MLALWADESAHFITETIDKELKTSLLYIDDGEPGAVKPTVDKHHRFLSNDGLKSVRHANVFQNSTIQNSLLAVIFRMMTGSLVSSHSVSIDCS